MIIENNEKDKNDWLKKEKRIRIKLMVSIISIILIIVICFFFREKIWTLIVGAGVILTIIVNIVNLKTLIKK